MINGQSAALNLKNEYIIAITSYIKSIIRFGVQRLAYEGVSSKRS